MDSSKPSKLKPPKSLDSIDDFLKQSEDLQDEIKRLSSLCNQESSKKSKPVPATSDSEYWKAINLSLSKHNFPQIPLKSPSLSTLADILVDVLTEYSSLKQELKVFQYSSKPVTERSLHSSRVRKSLEFVDSEFSDSYKLSVLDQVKSLIESKDYDSIVPDLEKIKKVIVSLPNVENFISIVCSELIPELPGPRCLDTAVSRLKTLLKVQKEFEFVLQENNSLKKIVDYYSKLFQVQGLENVMDSIESVFYFVHEIKDFLEACRQSLGLSAKLATNILLKEVLSKLNL